MVDLMLLSSLFIEGDNYSSAPPLDGSTPDDVDVLEEENVVKQQARDGAVLPNIAVQIRGLVRTYPGTRKGGCCCCGKKTAPYHAVKVKNLFQLLVSRGS